MLLGFSGGIVPCPAGLAIVLVAARFQALPQALIILIFFSLGLGAVLVGIGVTVALGKSFALKRGRLQPETAKALAGWLGVASALLIAGIGTYFIGEAIYKGTEPLGQMLQAAGRWLES